MIIDNFLKTYPILKRHSQTCEYQDIVNEVDGAVYPYICPDIPPEVEEEVYSNIEKVMAMPPRDTTIFIRQSPEGVNVPHQVHSDKVMGKYSLMLYMQNRGGTSFLHHKHTGIAYHPDNVELEDVIRQDQNNPNAWKMDEMVSMKENRAFIFKADRLHRAEPVGGYGQGSEARVVLTCFFS